MKIGICISPN